MYDEINVPFLENCILFQASILTIAVVPLEMAAVPLWLAKKCWCSQGQSGRALSILKIEACYFTHKNIN